VMPLYPTVLHILYRRGPITDRDNRYPGHRAERRQIPR
jgi:hypothetical protein